MPSVDVERVYLEMRSPSALRSAPPPHPGVRVERASPCSPELFRALYREVGEAYHWRDRLAWSDAELAAHLARPTVAVWLLHVGDDRAGFFELGRDDEGGVEIVYFGLTPRFIGRGLGKVLLARAVEEAWRDGAARVWLHTCSLDSPAALPNYQARGFVEVRREWYRAELPD